MKIWPFRLWGLYFLSVALIVLTLPCAEAKTLQFNTAKLGTISVIGDSLADGIWSGIYRSTPRKYKKNVKRYAKISAGLARADFYRWKTRLEEILRESSVVVFSIGLNDFVSMYIHGERRQPYWSKEWQRRYIQRVEYLMRRIQEEGDIITIWTGLPTLREPAMVRHAAKVNRIYENSAKKYGITFLPLRVLTQDDSGHFNLYGRALNGRIQRLRSDDGVHFTGKGYDLLAHYILQRIEQNSVRASAGLF